MLNRAALRATTDGSEMHEPVATAHMAVPRQGVTRLCISLCYLFFTSIHDGFHLFALFLVWRTSPLPRR